MPSILPTLFPVGRVFNRRVGDVSGVNPEVKYPETSTSRCALPYT